MIDLVVIRLDDVLYRCKALLLGIGASNKIDPRTLVKFLFTLGTSEDFDLTFWDYVESVMTPAEIENIPQTVAGSITEIIQILLDDIYSQIDQKLGVTNSISYTFYNWIGNDICLSTRSINNHYVSPSRNYTRFSDSKY